MRGFVGNIEQLTEANHDFRRVLYTGRYLQLVLMTLLPGADIGAETHADHDQFFRIETGKGIARIEGVNHAIEDGDAIIVPAGTHHNILNNGTAPLFLYTLYGPPNHRDGVQFVTRKEAEDAREKFDGRTTETS